MKEMIKRQLAFIVMIAMLVSMLPTSMLPMAVATAEDGEGGPIVIQSDPIELNEGGEKVPERSPLGDPPPAEGYTVTFFAKDAEGTYKVSSTQKVQPGNKPSVPANPIDTYAQIFDGWDSNATATVTGDMDVYAKYRDRKTVMYAVEFFMQDGTSAGVNTIYTAELEGKDINRTVDVPQIAGYTPQAAAAVTGFTLKTGGSYYQVAISDTKISADKTFRVNYVPNGNTPYTVNHWQQTVTGGAAHNSTNFTKVTADTQVLQGPTGSNVAPVAKTYTGFTLDTDIANIKISIAADGKTVVDLYYTRNEYSVYFELDGGTLPTTQPNPMVVRYGAPLNVSTITPSRLGYANANPKWLPVQPTGAIPTVMPADDVIVKANWTPQTATYKITLWAQNANDDGYSMYGVMSMPAATVESTINLSSITLPNTSVYTELSKYFTYDAAKTNEVTYKVAGDGSTMVDAYYSRNTYKVTFTIVDGLTMRVYRLSDGTITTIQPSSGSYTTLVFDKDTSPKHSITARYNQSLQTMWPTAGNFSGEGNSKSFTGWRPASENTIWASMRVNMTSEMCDAAPVEVTAQVPSSTVRLQYLHYRIESVTQSAGGNRVLYNGMYYENDPDISQYIYNDSTSWQAKDLMGVTRVAQDGVTVLAANGSQDPQYVYYSADGKTATYSNTFFYYTRNSYYIDFNNGSDAVVKKGPIKYGYPITTQNYTPNTPSNLAGLGYTFDGWFTDRSFAESARFNWNNGMPPNNVVLYAKWVAPTYKVTFNATPGSPNPATQTVTSGGTITTPSPVPTYFKHDLVGWYYEQGGSQVRFLETQKVYRDYNLIARWVGDDTVDVTVKYVKQADGSALTAPDALQGQLGDTLVIPAKGFPDYMPTVSSQTLALTNIQGHTVTFEYVTAKVVTYKVKYLDKATNQPVATEKLITYTPSSGVIPQATETRVLVPGYTADAYQKSILLVPDPAFNEIVFFYTKQANDTSYKVVHHFENLTSTGYTAEAGAAIPAYTGQAVTATPQTRTGFTYDASLSNASGTVLADGSTTLNLYYKRTRHSYVVNYVSLQTGSLGSVTRTQVKYGASVTETQQAFPGNVYVGFVVGSQSGTAASATATITNNATVFTFNYNTMYTITATAVNGTITPASRSVEHGKNASFTYSPNTYYELDKVLVDGVVVVHTDPANYTFSNVTKDHTLEVQFKKKQFQLTVSAVQQKYVYNAALQGFFGNTTDTKYVTVTGLQAGHTVKSVTLSGSQKINAGTYADEIKPTTIVIEDAQGNDASGFYVITRNNANLVIDKKGDGTDQNGDQIPIKVPAAAQTYVYNGQLQGKVGLQNISAANPLASATGLIAGHELKQVTLGGSQKRDVGTYTNELKPTLAVIMAGSTDVTANYLITAASYIPATLQITKFDGGATITAKKQEYTYNGAAQGHFGTNLTVAAGDPYVEANGLLTGHVLKTVTLKDVSTSAQNLKDAGTYAKVVKPESAVIIDTTNGNADVTANYTLTYVNGDIVINKKGNGTGPLDITAQRQVFTYNGAVQGTFGANLTINAAKPQAIADGLVSGHKLQLVTLAKNPSKADAIDAGTYTDHIVPSAAKIVDGSGTDVTANYRIETGSYHNGVLLINPKGNGTVDPTDPDGREYPLDITAIRQEYIYNGQFQGNIGAKATRATSEAVLTAATKAQLLTGQYYENVTINTLNNEGQKREPQLYPSYLIPAAVKISNGVKDVTANYRIEASSYHAGDLLITKKGSNDDNSKPIRIIARDQTFIYNHQPQGYVGVNLLNQDASYGTQLASSIDLAAGHYIKYIDLNVAKKTDVGTYTGYLPPSNAKIYAMQNNVEVDVTANYLLDGTSYKNGTLKIGTNDDAKVKVIARNQTYTYDGTPKGVVGAQTIAYQTQAGRDAAQVYATGLYDGHYLSYAVIGGTQQTNAGTYNTLVPSGAKIVDISGADVSSNYNMSKIEYVTGTLLINPKGNGTVDPQDPDGREYPLDIYALQQEYIYDGTAKGDFGEKAATTGSTLLKATGVVPGQQLYATLSADASQYPAIDADTYQKYIVPGSARIMSGATNVTANYRIEASSYNAANLIIHKKGNGTPDPAGGEYPLQIYAKKQSYVYDATFHGDIGAKTGTAANQVAINAVIEKTVKLVNGQYISDITILTKNNEGQKKDPATYTDYLIPSAVVIRDASGKDVTKNYRIEGTNTYIPADLFIDKRGTGPDNENPITITALNQTYTYTGQPQGIVGTDIDVPATLHNGNEVAFAGAGHLAAGHIIKYIDLAVPQQTNVGVYTNHLVPSKVVILDTLDSNRNVTDFYKIDSTSYIKGTLEIQKSTGTLKVTAQTQTYTYDGTVKGQFGTFAGLTKAQMDKYAVATGLNAGHTLVNITLTDVSSPAQNLIDAMTYSKVIRPSSMKIVDGSGVDVTSNYAIDANTYVDGDLIIKPRGVGPDLDQPITVRAVKQEYIYNDQLQGIVGTNLAIVTSGKTLATTTDLLPNHELRRVDMGGSQKILPATYTNELKPSNVVIWDTVKNVQVPSSNYVITAASYIPADLVIEKKGDNNDNEKPINVIAASQTYEYDNTPKGLVGTNLVVGNQLITIVNVPDLLPGHYAYTVTIAGPQKTDPGSYPNNFTPSNIVIRKGSILAPSAMDEDMTAYYKITADSYKKGELVITPKGGASLVVTANDQKFVYDGTPKGYLGTRTTDAKDLVTVQGLYSGHYVAQASITLTNPAMDHTNPGKHPGVLNAGNLVIRNANAGNADVSHYYNLAGATYNPGTLIINKKGDGDPDPQDPDGGELPLTITAADQSFVYNAAVQGHVGTGLTVDDPAYQVILAAVQKGLLPGHKLKSITMQANGSLTGMTNVGTYTLTPTAAVIVDAGGTDVTSKYNIVPTSYKNGTLRITQKKVTVTSLPQAYTYNASPRGVVGALDRAVIPATFDNYAKIEGVANAGHLLQTVTLNGAQQTVPGTYTLTPSSATVMSGATDVTANYEFTYVAGPLTIVKKGNGADPILVEAKKQIYVYNDQPQGNVGKNLTASAVVTVTGVLPVHEAYLVDIDVAKKTDAGTYTNYLTPSNIRIRDIATQADVTAYYYIDQYTAAQLAAGNLVANKTYKPNTLLINPKGDGTPVDPTDPEKGENPFKVTAVRQAYVYNGLPQGDVGTLNTAAKIASRLSTDTLLSGHTIKSVVISDATAQRTDPNLDGAGNAIDYVDLLVPKSIQIFNGSNVDVTKNYKITYHKGNLFIDKKGSGGNNSDPIVVKAIDQDYSYDGLAHGIVGAISDVALAQYKHEGQTVVTSAHLVSGQRIKAITINASQETAAGVYTDVLKPFGVSIVNAAGVDVTKFYKIDNTTNPVLNQTYKPGTLTIDKSKKTVTITLKDQSYVYNGTPQGQVGGTTVTVGSPYVTATGLESGERLAWVNINQTQRTVPGTYPLAILPSINGGTLHVKILNSSNVDVTANYDVESFKLVAATMTIKKRPVTITVQPQTYIYNSTPQGVAGGTFSVNTGLPYPTILAVAQANNGAGAGMMAAHTFSTITLGGAPRINAGTTVLPGTSVVILDGVTPVQAYYDVKFVNSTLTVKPIGVGPSGDDPISISAIHQAYNYNAKPQGKFGVFTDPLNDNLAQVDNNVLLPNHKLATITLSGKQETNVGTYAGRIVPTQAVIRDIMTGEDVTANYVINASSYKKANLIIQPVATPVQLVATEQVYIYNAQPQGKVGAITIAANDTAPLVTTAQPLLQGHRLSRVYLNGSQQTNAGTYANELMPRTAGTIIVDSKGNNVTANYTFAPAHIPADLVINKKGNGEDDGNGGEKPMNVWAKKQDYVYNAQPQGKFGTLTYEAALAQIIGLLPGHKVSTITLSGSQQTFPALYADAIEPTGIVILDAANNDVTVNYLLTPASYRKADLEIHKKGDGTPDGNGGENPMKITTPDQVFVYDAQPHGNFGVNLPVGAGNPLATAVQLLPGHEIEYITLVGAQQTNAGKYVDAITPANIKIIDSATHVDETANYNIVPSSYIPATLWIRQRGYDGDPNKPMQVTVGDERYIYNGKLQGSYGEVAIPSSGQTTATLSSGTNGLMPGHTFTAVIIADNRQMHAGVYPAALMPTGVRILDAAGVDVSANYFFNDTSWIGGTLTIDKLGREDNDGNIVPILIVAEDQTYYYNGRPQGYTGKNIRAQQRMDLVYTEGLLDGDYVFEIDISGKRQAAVGEYPDTFMPSNAMILNAFGENVTGDYMITKENTYFAGALIILEAEDVLGVFDLETEYHGITSRDVGDLVE